LALDREDTLKKADKLLRQGRLDAAIAEYVRVVEDQPRDWTTANTLGDLYVRAKQSDKAVAQYARIARHFFEDGFYPKAAALYKKILKITPDDEESQLQLADLSARQGLLADAKAYYQAVAARRRARNDRRGADEIVVRLGTVDPGDIEARTAAARLVADNGDQKGAAALLRALHADLAEKGREHEALVALGEAVRLDPLDAEGRGLLAKAALAAGDIQGARGYLDRKAAGEDPSLLRALVDLELRAGQLQDARELLRNLLTLNNALRHDLTAEGWALLSDALPDAAFVCIDAAIDAAVAVREFEEAASTLQEFIARRSAYVPALLKLVEVCVDGGLESTMYDAQAQLADAHLAAGQGADARMIAEDLVAREPWERAHIDRFRRALVMLRVSEPDMVIAERLSGQSPFLATDHFSAPASSAGAAAASELPESPSGEVLPSGAAPSSGTQAQVQRDLGEIDLSGALGDSDESRSVPIAAPPSLDSVFKGLRKDAGRDGADQSVQHMKLARTYIELGMIDEASASLETAARSPRQRFEAAAMLGRLYREHGDLAHAIEWFERAAEAHATGVDDSRALLYDFGVALEEAGETTRALAVFLELQADATDYRDVAVRADRLARVQAGG
jgi:tetratricopeptide (TPR) repeat protein